MKEHIYYKVLNTAPFGYAYHKIVLDEFGKADDYIFLEVNPAFEKMTGLSSETIINKKVTEIIPNIKELKFNWIELYGDIALNGGEKEFERYSELVNKWFKVQVFSPEKLYFVTTFLDITSEKEQLEYKIKAEEEIKQKNEEINRNILRLESLVSIFQEEKESIKDFLDYSLDELLKITESKIGYIFFYNEETKEFTLTSWSKNVMKECSIENFQKIYQLEKTGLWGEAVRQRKAIIVNDYSNFDKWKKGYPEGHLDLNNFLSIPIFFQQKIVAVAGVANKESNYNHSDVLQMTLLMDAVWKTTERKKSQLALEKSEEPWRRIINASPDGIATSTLDGIVVSASENSVKMWGYDSEKEIIGKNILDFLDISYKERAVFYITEMMQGNYTGPAEYLMVKKDGSKFFCEANGEIIRDAKGNPTGLIFIERDITERKEYEKKIEESELQFQRIIESLPIALTIVSLDGRVLFANPKGYELFEISPEDQNKTIKAADFWLDPSERDKWMMEIREKGEAKDYLMRMRGSSGREFWVIGSGIIIDYKNQKCTLSSVQDISKHIKVENELKESEARYRSLFENSKAVMLIVNPLTGRIIDANTAASSFYGWRKDEILSKTIYDLNTMSLEEINKEMDAAKQQKKACFNFTHRLANGEIKDVEVFSGPISIQNQNFLYSIIHDITERKKAENTLKRYFEELESINEELQVSKETIEENLFQKNELITELEDTKAKMEVAIAEKDKFFSIIAHDLKSPFQGFLGLTKIIAEDLNELSLQEVQQYSSLMMESAENVYKLLENLLEWSRLQREMITFEPQELNLSYLIDSIVEVQKGNAFSKSLSLENLIDREILIKADENMLNTILRNLISNAIKFTPRDGIIKIGSNKKGNMILVSISDSGIGIPPKMLKKLFTVGEKTSRLGTEGESSTGLGLILCKEYISKHGGEIWVESEENVGSTFYFTLPMP